MTVRELEHRWHFSADHDVAALGAPHLQWTNCQIQESADLEFKFRYFDDPSLRMAALALSTFAKSPASEPDERILAYLLYYSFGKTSTALSFSKPFFLAPQLRAVIVRAVLFFLENLTDRLVEDLELDSLDILQLQALRGMF